MPSALELLASVGECGRARSGAGVVKEVLLMYLERLLKNNIIQSFFDLHLVLQQIIDFNS
jgi:hypothetical protein